MGCCCDKSAMPVVDASEQPTIRRQRDRRRGEQSEAVTFDFVYNDDRGVGNSSFAGSTASRRRAPAGRHSPSFAAAGSAGSELVTFTPRDFDEVEVDSSGEGSRRRFRQPVFMTNAHEEIGPDLVGSFVGTLRDSSVDPLTLIMGPSSQTGGRRPRSTPALTDEDRTYIFSALSAGEQRSRLMDLEEIARGEMIGAMLVTARMVELGARQILPTIRQRHTSLSVDGKPQEDRSKKSNRKPLQAKSPRTGAARKPVLVIHAPGVAVAETSPDQELDGSTSVFLDTTQDNMMISVVSEDDMYSRRNSTSASSARRRSTHKDPNSALLVSPAAASDSPPRESPERPSGQIVEQYEILALSGHSISRDSKVTGKVVTSTWDFLSLPEAQSHLNAGNTFFRFVSGGLAKVSPQDREFVRLYANITGFADEAKENFCPVVDPFDPVQQSKYIVILVKAMYILPGVLLSNITQDLLASLDYNRNCQPGDVRFEEKDIPPRTFREVKTIVKFVYSLTIQMYVTEITDPEILFSLKESDGMVPTKVIVLERTKRTPSKIDSTAKCKSVLMYYAVNGGVLVSHATIVMNTSVPTVVARILNTFGGQGCGECAETAKLTRAYLLSRFGDTRK
jgi:hypothetical protein